MDFDKCFHVLFEHAREVRLEFVAAEVLQHFSPLGRLVKVAQVRPHVTAQNTEGRRLSDTIGTHETQDLACSGGRESMQFEAVGAVAMGHLALQALREIDDFDGLEGAALDAHAAAVTEVLGDEADGRGGSHLNAHLADLVYRARPGALLSALFGLALIGVNDCDSELEVCHISMSFASC